MRTTKLMLLTNYEASWIFITRLLVGNDKSTTRIPHIPRTRPCFGIMTERGPNVGLSWPSADLTSSVTRVESGSIGATNAANPLPPAHCCMGLVPGMKPWSAQVTSARSIQATSRECIRSSHQPPARVSTLPTYASCLHNPPLPLLLPVFSVLRPTTHERHWSPKILIYPRRREAPKSYATCG